MAYITTGAKFDSIRTPVGELAFVTISGKGKHNTLNGKYEYQCTLLLEEDSQECKDLIAEIEQYAANFKQTLKNAPNKKKAARSLGYQPHKVNSGEKDEDGAIIWLPTTLIAFRFKTETTWKDGKPKIIPLYNSKGNQVALGDRMIGNGSRGRVTGIIKGYEQAADWGVSLYLTSLQLAKFVAYTGGDSYDAIETDDDGFEGFDDGTEALPETQSEQSSAPANTGRGKPRL